MPFGQASQKLKHRVKACFVFVVMLMIAGNAYAYEICRSGSKINVECTEREFSDWSGTCQAFGWVSADYEIKHLASADYADMEGECAGFVEGRSPILLAKKPYYLICKMSDLYIERPYNESLDSDATGHIVNYRWGTFEFSVVGSCAYATDAHGTAAGALSASRGRYCPQGFVDRGYDDGFAPCWRHMVYEDHSCPVGNPTLPGQGVKTHTETLITANGITSLPLNLTYRSKYSGDTRLPNGAWLHSYQHMVHHKPNGAYVYISRPDGRVFRYDEKSTDLVWVSTETFDKLTETSSGWQLNVLENDSIETYDLSGRLQSIRQRNGSTTTLHYNAQQQLTTVTAPLGRTLDFAYNSAGQLASVRASSGELTQLGYDTAGNLSTLIRSDGRTRYFHYENATYEHALTGITDETGQRIGTYAYNADGRVFDTQRALGVDHYQFFYGSDTQGLPLTYVVNLSSGQPQQRTYNFNVQGRVLRPSVIGVPYGQSETPQETQYDDQGQKIREISHDGRVIFYSYNAKGRITREATYPASFQSATTAPPLNQAERVTSTQWHGTWNLPLKTAEAYLITSYSYDGKGNLLELIETPTSDTTGAKGFNAVPSGDTQTTQWAYDTRNLPSTIVEQSAGVETGRWDISYDTKGDMIQITHVTSGTVATLVPVGNGASQITAITPQASPAVNSSMATVRALGFARASAAAAGEMEMPHWGTPIKANEVIKMCSWVWRPKPAILALLYPAKTSQCSDLPPKNPDECDDCVKDWEKEQNRCWRWKGMGSNDDPNRWVRACEERASERLVLCYKNGGSMPSDPKEWGREDMQNP